MIHKSSGLPLFVCEPPQVVCWTRVSTIEIEKGNFKSNTTNFNESFTDGWLKGSNKNVKQII